MILTKEQEIEVFNIAQKRSKSNSMLTLGEIYWSTLIGKYPQLSGKFIYNEYDCYYKTENLKKLREYLVQE